MASRAPWIMAAFTGWTAADVGHPSAVSTSTHQILGVGRLGCLDKGDVGLGVVVAPVVARALAGWWLAQDDSGPVDLERRPVYRLALAGG